MQKTILYFFLVIFLVFVSLFIWLQLKPTPLPLQQVGEQSISLKKRAFSALPGWQASKLKSSLLTFQVSCKTFLRQAPEQDVGSLKLSLKAKDWQPSCLAAQKVDINSEQALRAFFQKWFIPVEFREKTAIEGLFTGYYMALLQGSKTKSKDYAVPIYGLPQDLITVKLGQFNKDFGKRLLRGRLKGKELIPYYTRAEINQGALKKKAKTLIWVNSRIERLFLEIQGSGTVLLADGSKVHLGYEGENGAPYTAIAKVLIDKGVMTRDNASMQHIKHYLETNPQEMDAVLHQNKSFVFFRRLKDEIALGAQGVPLTPGYSLAVDRQWIPLGAPLWLDTTRPDGKTTKAHKLQRLMIAQDTGGAIRGAVRGDVYWGAGAKATLIAGHMKNKGYYWLLLPRHSVEHLLKNRAY